MQYEQCVELIVIKKSKPKCKQGFSLVEVIVAVGLLGVMALIVSGFIIPLQVTRSSSVETQAMVYAKTYIEITKNRWLDPNTFTNSANAWSTPTVSSNASTNPDILIPANWSISAIGASGWTAGDTLRNLKVQVTDNLNKTYTVETQVAKP